MMSVLRIKFEKFRQLNIHQSKLPIITYSYFQLADTEWHLFVQENVDNINFIC